VEPEYLLGRMQYVGKIRFLAAFSLCDAGTTQTSRHLGLGSPAVLTLVYNMPQLCCVLEK
jgi:hypothetical protein